MACPFNSFSTRSLRLPTSAARAPRSHGQSRKPVQSHYPHLWTIPISSFRPHTQRTNLANSHWGRTAVQEQPTLERSAHLPWDYFPLPLIHPERRTQEILADKVR